MANHNCRYVCFFNPGSFLIFASAILATSFAAAQVTPTEDESEQSYPPVEIRLKKANDREAESSAAQATARNTRLATKKNVSQAATKPSAQRSKKFADQFWTYLLSNNYKHWAPLPGKPTDAFATESKKLLQTGVGSKGPHTDLMKVYMNRTAASNPNEPPVGSVLVVENLRPDRSLESISVMYRTEGFNPQGNDWYWVNYNPDGSVTKASLEDASTLDSDGNVVTYSSKRVSPIKLMGRATSCMACHEKSSNADFAFFNDRSKDGLSLRSAGIGAEGSVVK